MSKQQEIMIGPTLQQQQGNKPKQKAQSSSSSSSGSGPAKFNFIPGPTKAMLRAVSVFSSIVLAFVSFGWWEVENDAATGAILALAITAPVVLTWYITSLKW